MEKIYYNIRKSDFTYVVSETEHDDIKFVNIKYHTDKPTVPSNFSVWFFLPCIDAYSLWSPNCATQRVLSPYGFVTNIKSGVANGAPVASLISKSGINRLTVAVDDVATASNIKICVCEDNQSVLFDITMFTEISHPITDYEMTLRLDQTNARYEEVLSNIEKWWSEKYPACKIPAAAREPVFSTWYNYHQMINDEELLSQCETAVKYGIKTIIIDDGWQTGDNNKGYSYCGDWQPEPSKIKDMKTFVERIHNIGMKVMLWYSVPYVGENSENYSKFEGKFLNKPNGWGILDPRYPECRKFTVDLYKNAVLNWGLDGLKLDFIDSFKLTEYSSKEYDKMDYVSLEEAISALLNEIGETLKSINPDFLIEFRQKYIGPAVRQVGSMLRVGDCPCSSEQNKLGIVDIRMIAGKNAVHSDMIMWHKNDTVESAALQMISALYSVPQISVKMDDLTLEQQKMLNFYLKFWINNKEILLDGELTANNPENLYSLIKSELDGKAVITAYSQSDVDITGLKSGSIVNATGENRIIISTDTETVYSVYDCMGNLITENEKTIGIKKLFVPKSGMICFTA